MIIGIYGATGNRGQVYAKEVKLLGLKAFPTHMIHKSIQNYIIATPDHTHYKIAKKLLENKKNVLLEKFPCKTKNEFNKLLEISNEYDLNFTIGWTFLFNDKFNFKNKDLNFIWTKPISTKTNKEIYKQLSCHHVAIMAAVSDEIYDLTYKRYIDEFVIKAKFLKDNKIFNFKSSIVNGLQHYHFFDNKDLRSFKNISPVKIHIINWLSKNHSKYYKDIPRITEEVYDVYNQIEDYNND